MCINGGTFSEFERSAPGGRASNVQFAERRFEAHAHLFFEGDAKSHLFVVESGWVKIYRTLIDGQRQVVGFCNGGTILGLEGGEEQINGCEALTAVKVRLVPLNRLAQVCASTPELAEVLMRQMGRQLGTAQAQLTAVGAQSADQKLANFLLSFADHSATAAGEFDLPMRRGDIAEFLGLRLETISRKMTEFQRRGWIRMVSLYRCKLLNVEALSSLREGEEGDEGGRRVGNA